MLGKLNWDALPLGQPIPLAAGAFVVLVIVGGVAFVTLKGWVPYLWREWITSVDHKRIMIASVKPRSSITAASVKYMTPIRL